MDALICFGKGCNDIPDGSNSAQLQVLHSRECPRQEGPFAGLQPRQLYKGTCLKSSALQLMAAQATFLSQLVDAHAPHC